MVKELNKFILSAIAIIGLTVIVLVGMAVSIQFSRVLRTTTTLIGINTTVTTSLEPENVPTVLSGLPFLQELSGCSNSTSGTVLPAANFTIAEGDANGGTITLTEDGANNSWGGVSLNCSSIQYLADSDGQAAADKFTTGLGTFGTFAVILILAIVGKAIIGLFKRKD